MPYKLVFLAVTYLVRDLTTKEKTPYSCAIVLGAMTEEIDKH